MARSTGLSAAARTRTSVRPGRRLGLGQRRRPRESTRTRGRAGLSRRGGYRAGRSGAGTPILARGQRSRRPRRLTLALHDTTPPRARTPTRRLGAVRDVLGSAAAAEARRRRRAGPHHLPGLPGRGRAPRGRRRRCRAGPRALARQAQQPADRQDGDAEGGDGERARGGGGRRSTGASGAARERTTPRSTRALGYPPPVPVLDLLRSARRGRSPACSPTCAGAPSPRSWRCCRPGG